MDFTRTARAVVVAALIGAAMLGMTAFSAATEESVKAREAATAAYAAPAPEETPEAAQDQRPEPETQTTFVPATEPEEGVIEAVSVEGITYRGIEPYHTEEDVPDRAPYYPQINLDRVMQDFIFVEAGEAAVDYELVLAIIQNESGGDPNAISATGDYGLMQINKCNHAWLAENYGLTDMLDPKQNVIAGITILATLYQSGDNTEAGLHKILMAYNMGPGGAAEAWAAGRYTSAYSRTVMETWAALTYGDTEKGGA